MKAKSKNQGKENEVLEMFSTSKLVNDLMRRDGLTVDLMAEATGKPVQHIIEIIKRVRWLTQEDALLFERRLRWSAEELLDRQLRDLMAMDKALWETAKIWLGVLKLGVDTLELRDLVDKTLRAVSEL
jgi:plasmid maintenance system antidote protein VapI